LRKQWNFDVNRGKYNRDTLKLSSVNACRKRQGRVDGELSVRFARWKIGLNEVTEPSTEGPKHALLSDLSFDSDDPDAHLHQNPQPVASVHALQSMV
jgi:hypothetical protein